MRLHQLISATLFAFHAAAEQAYHRAGHGIDSHSVEDIVQKLNLTSNVEGGYYIQTYADPGTYANNRSYSSLIYYLLPGSVGASRWHSVLDATEVWHYYAGAPLRLDLSWNNGSVVQHKVLGSDIFHGQAPQMVIEKGRWQRAQSLGNWTLVGTTVAPAFLPDNGSYALAADGWAPNGA